MTSTFDPFDPPQITIEPPPIPQIVLAPPVSSTVHVVPMEGPQGPRGPAGDETGLGFVYTQSQPATLVQIQHNLPYKPAGIVCLEADGSPPLLGVSVSYPAVGVTELGFGAAFTGSIYLS